MSAYYFIICFFVYGFLGWCTEVAFAAVKQHKFVNRGFLNGPICPIYGIGVSVVVQFLSPYRSNLILLYVASVVLVTTLEWLTGFILEKVFHNKWWDYSNMPLNLNGYVCLLFSLIWGVACVLIVDFIHPVIYTGLTYIPHVVGIVLIAVFGAALVVDLYVTVAGILKMNRRLARMDEIAGELHRMSEQLGENIYRGVMETIEKQEESKKKLDATTQEWKERTETVSEEVKQRIKELRDSYQELKSGRSPVHKRLLKAFPKMESGRYKEAMRDLKEYLEEKKRR